MPTLIIRDVPEKTYQRLKAQAEKHRRSMAKEALVVLEDRLNPYDVPRIDWKRWPQVTLKGNPKLDPGTLQAMIDQGRE